jgi:uncharacterized protein (DUF1800 family)
MTRLSPTLAIPFFAATMVAHAGPPIGEDGARHLLARTGFGPTAAEVARFAPLDRETAVARVLASPRSLPVTTPPAALTDDAPIGAPPEGATNEERRAYIREQVRLGLEMRGWWMREMLATESPLAERMTLFWHNHFVSSQQKVRSAKLMYRQNATLRRYALGDFGALLRAEGRRDAPPNGVRNRRAAQRAFAREVMELFTLGEGRYRGRRQGSGARSRAGASSAAPVRSCSAARCTTRARRPSSAARDASTATRSSTSCSSAPRPPR